MGKLICTALLALIIASCTSGGDDPDNIVPENALLTKTIETDSEGYSYTTNFIYNGNKLVSYSDNDGEIATVTYTGDYITMIEYSFDGEVEQRDLFTYNPVGELVSYKSLYPQFNSGHREDFTYNVDGSITAISHHGDLIAQTQEPFSWTMTRTDGEITLLTSEDGETVEISYDDKLNPVKNILGFSKISFVDGVINGFFHNVTSRTGSYDGSPEIISTSYTYNSTGFPVTSSENDDGEVTTTQYFYE